MKKILNTLYVTSQGAYLNKEGETVVVSVAKEKLLQVPIHALEGIVCFGQVGCSPFLLGHCAEKGVAVTFLSENGYFLASVNGLVSGNVLLRRQQYRFADNPDISASIARNFLIGKIANCRTVIQRARRDYSERINQSEIEETAIRLSRSIDILKRNEPFSLEELRGIEGDAAHSYFATFDHLIVQQKKDFQFKGRTRRPPKDNVNCLLSFVYTLVMHDVRAALETVGLDSCVGFLHRDRPGRSSLALDMMEELRSVIADRLVLSLINRSQVNFKGFSVSETGAVMMTDEARKTILVEYQKRKQEEIMHPFLKEKIKMGLVFYIQALLMARYIRGDIDGYPVFLWK